MDIKTWIWIGMTAGGWLISGAVAYTTIRLAIKRLLRDTEQNTADIILIERRMTKRLYKDGVPIYQLHADCEKQNVERDKKRNEVVSSICSKLDEVKTSVHEIAITQNEMNGRIENLLGRFDSYIETERTT